MDGTDTLVSAREDEAPRRCIIDMEKESVVLMAEALEELGDSYAVCGFSGYGKDLVDYYLCKDFDYGKDRNLREYGIQDTTKALSEARHKGVQTFCLTVDPPVTTT